MLRAIMSCNDGHRQPWQSHYCRMAKPEAFTASPCHSTCQRCKYKTIPAKLYKTPYLYISWQSTPGAPTTRSAAVLASSSYKPWGAIIYISWQPTANNAMYMDCHSQAGSIVLEVHNYSLCSSIQSHYSIWRCCKQLLIAEGWVHRKDREKCSQG